MRNTVGFDWHPDTKEMYFTDNGRDGESGVLPVPAGLQHPRPASALLQHVHSGDANGPHLILMPCLARAAAPQPPLMDPPPRPPTHPPPPFCSLPPVDMGGLDTAFTDNHPDCELNYAPSKGLHFGYPYCHTGPAGDQVDARPYLRLPGVGTNEVDPQLNIGESQLVCNGERGEFWGQFCAAEKWLPSFRDVSRASGAQPPHHPLPAFPTHPHCPDPFLPHLPDTSPPPA